MHVLPGINRRFSNDWLRRHRRWALLLFLLARLPGGVEVAAGDEIAAAALHEIAADPVEVGAALGKAVGGAVVVQVVVVVAVAVGHSHLAGDEARSEQGLVGVTDLEWKDRRIGRCCYCGSASTGILTINTRFFTLVNLLK